MVEPEVLPAGAAVMARLNVNGRIISVISYDETYTDDAGKDHQLFVAGNEYWLIDQLNTIMRVGGVDYAKDIRSVL